MAETMVTKKPTHNIRTKPALLELLKSKRGQEVVAQDYKELKEGWPDIFAAVNVRIVFPWCRV